MSIASNTTNSLNPSSIFEDVVRDLVQDKVIEKIPPLNVLEFSKKLLDIDLRKAQEIILKLFYIGTRFNDELKITKDDIEVIESWSIPQGWILYGENSKLNVLEKIEKITFEKRETTDEWFNELILVLGRRGGKSFISSLIAVYEAYKLLQFKNPQKFYNIHDNDIWIINTASSKDQAKDIVFQQIRKFVHACGVFKGRIQEKEGIIRIFTDADIERNKSIIKEGGKPIPGSVVIASGHSNSVALRGHATIVIICDEMAHYVDTNGRSSAEEVYRALAPSVKDFYPYGDGRVVLISSPDRPCGYFYKMYEKSKSIDSMLMFQLPTWEANPAITKIALNDEFNKDPKSASAEYGALFQKYLGSHFFPHDKVDEALVKQKGLYKHKEGVPGNEYYLHLDPSKNSDKWGVLIAHPEYRYSEELKTSVQYVVEDYSNFFVPPQGGYLDPDDIMDHHILPLYEKFRIVSTTFDSFLSLEQQKKLALHGINFREISFAGRVKNEMYDTAKEFFINGRVELCNDDIELAGQLKNITIRYTKGNPKIEKSEESDEFPDDDLVDCFCGIVHSIALGPTGKTHLPSMRTVNAGMF